ncbi:hypothetical protein [Arsenicicoccus dermatophilus]|uniref:hypothetical protein n=1 Tax=Arsenicicoccus dermatophilus TaxID=1076331 RepID=UPI003916CEF0
MSRPPAGFDGFARASATPLCARAMLLRRDHHLAEDLVPKTLAARYVRWRRIGEVGDPLAYARRTLANAYVDRTRRRGCHEPPLEHLPDPGTDPYDGTDHAALRIDPDHALARVTPEQLNRPPPASRPLHRKGHVAGHARRVATTGGTWREGARGTPGNEDGGGA